LFLHYTPASVIEVFLIKNAILYITRNGMLEPLGQSQVLSYLRGLSENYRASLISFEKSEDLEDKQAFGRVAADCDKHGIRWLPQRFHYRPKVIAPAWSMLVFLFLCLREVRKGNADLIHARAYIPAAVALLVQKLTGTPFIFDMRALWPEELITAGRLKRGSLMHKAIAWIERSCLKNAAAVVSLTHAAGDYLREKYPDELSAQKLVVIPTCADLERFIPSGNGNKTAMVYSCVGTVLSGWFHLDWLATFFKRWPIEIRKRVLKLSRGTSLQKCVGNWLVVKNSSPALTFIVFLLMKCIPQVKSMIFQRCFLRKV